MDVPAARLPAWSSAHAAHGAALELIDEVGVVGRREGGATGRERGDLGCLGFLQLLRLFQLLPAELRLKIFRRHHGVAERLREFFRAVAGEHHVDGLVHDVAGEVDRILDVVDAGNGARRQRTTVHDGGVQFADAVGVHDGALAGVEQRGILHDVDRRGDGLEGGAPFLQHGVTRVEGRGEFGPILRLECGRHLVADDHPGAAVDDEAVFRGRDGVGGEDASGERQKKE